MKTKNNMLREMALPLLAVVMAMLAPVRIVAQNYDYGSVEAYINDHKQQRSLLMARATLEYGNKLLHEESAESADDYKEVNFDLDKYTRAFEIIDIIYQSVRTAVNVYHHIDDVRETTQGYNQLITDFHEKIVSRGKFETADTILVSINRRVIEKLAREGEYLYHSVYDLTLYCTGVAACTTADLIVVLENINASLERLSALLRSAYLATWKYVQVRLGYWKGKVYNSIPLQQLLDDAFSRWRNIGYEVLHNQIDQ